MPPAARVRPDETYGRLTVIVEARERDAGQRAFICRCSCGTVVRVRASHLRSGKSRSCGCLRAEKATARINARNRTHGRARTPEYRAWARAVERCFYPQTKRFEDWGGRGITMCERYRSDPGAFMDDLGSRPGPTYSLDRVDNEGHYSCGACEQCRANGWPMNLRWATRSEQRRNRRPYPKRTHCKRGHPLTPDNVYESGGSRKCRRCVLDRQARARRHT